MPMADDKNWAIRFYISSNTVCIVIPEGVFVDNV